MTRLFALIAMIFVGSVAVAAQHGPEPKPQAEKAQPEKAPETKSADAKGADGKAADAKASDAKAAEAKAAATRRGASASPLQTAAAIEQILRKLRDEGGTAPARRQSQEAARPRLRLTWRLTLTWPTEVVPAKTAP